MKSFGWSLPGDFVDESIAKSFQERQQTFLDNKKEDSKKKWRDFYDSYIQSDAWRKKRDVVLKRDNYICQGCLKNRAVHVHHQTYDHIGNELLWELTSVCLECHQVIHPHMRTNAVSIDWDSFK